ncbi:MAG: YybH family protein, partial [Candidatus Binataceae bacterium]
VLALLNQAGLLGRSKPVRTVVVRPFASESMVVVPPVPGGREASEGSDSEVRTFVRKYLAIQNRGDVPALLELYASQVDYFGHPKVSREFILKDKENYYHQWVVENALSGKIAVVDGPDRAEKVATFTVHFRATNPRLGKTSEGNATNVLTLRNNDGELRIVGELQTFYRRGPA